MAKTVEIPKARLQGFKDQTPLTFQEEEYGFLAINNVVAPTKEGVLPARFLSGYLPSFELAKTIQAVTDGQILPQVRIFIPQNMAKFTNGINPTAIDRQMQQGEQLIRAFAEKYYPKVGVFIERDQPVTEETIRALGNITSLFTHDGQTDTIRSIRESGRRRGEEKGEKNALLYAAHHPFGWNDLYSNAIFDRVPPVTVISTLPPSEQRYTQVRREIKERIQQSDHKTLVCSGQRIELVIDMCGTPSYMVITDNNGLALEPTIEDLLTTKGGELLQSLERRAAEEQNPGRRHNLFKAKSDLEKLFVTAAGGKETTIFDASFADITGIRQC